jgi:hypothetical protein
MKRNIYVVKESDRLMQSSFRQTGQSRKMPLKCHTVVKVNFFNYCGCSTLFQCSKLFTSSAEHLVKARIKNIFK